MKYSRGERPSTPRADRETVGKTETFLTRNVRLITFLIVIGLFLAVFGPLSVFRIREFILEKNKVENPIPMEQVIAISDLNRDVYLKELLPYSGTRKDGEMYIFYYMDVGADYLVLATADKVTGKLQHMILTRLSTGEQIDVLRDDVRAFLQPQNN